MIPTKEYEENFKGDYSAMAGPAVIESAAEERSRFESAAISAVAAMPPGGNFERARTALIKKLKAAGWRAVAVDAAIKRIRKSLEQSNSSGSSPTQTATWDSSNGCSNTEPIRTVDDLHASTKEIIEARDVLGLIRNTVKAVGYAGDPTPVLLIYVAITSRLQEKPINAHVIAQAATGKNFALNTALMLIPPEAVHKMTASTPKAFIYTDQDLQHKVIILGECDSILNLEGNAATLVRSIVEDSRTDYDTVEKDPETGRNVVRRVSKEGPTGLITTGVRDLESQMGTRMLTVHLPDSPEDTREVLRAEATIAMGAGPAPDPEMLSRFQDYQRWLGAQSVSQVFVPYALVLGEQVPAAEVRMRRDFKQLLAIIKAIALLNQHHRQRAEKGAIVADLSDYEWARALILSTFRSIVGGGITDAIRRTCEAVSEGEEISEAELALRLNLAKSTISYRVTRAVKGGWLINSETRRGYGYRLSRGTALPDDKSPLPTAEQVRAAFEQTTNSNGLSNGPLHSVGMRSNERAFERSNDSEDEIEVTEGQNKEDDVAA